ncbi:MAG TPA: class I SAM-dependent methyltransferase [Chthoniobacterales bacterium]|nr:class I SAM-dependent methyltransferase [Chthoniobacterales bacterium]
MTAPDPIDALFAEMHKLGPGSDADTQRVLRFLPKEQFGVVVDAGCGAGRQTIALAKALRTTIHAVDSHEPFLRHLQQRAEQTGVAHLIQTHFMDMKDIPSVFPEIDLLWSEGAAYNIGFSAALETWATAIAPGGFAVVSELCWLRDDPPDAVREFFAAGYPQMRSVEENIATAERAGYKVCDVYTLPADAWREDYYDVLEPRARSLVDDPDPAIRELAAGTLAEIEIFARAEGSYGYVFFVLERLPHASNAARGRFLLPFFWMW